MRNCEICSNKWVVCPIKEPCRQAMVLREGEAVRQGQSQNFEGLIEVSQIIRDGIQ